jgi:hypothetical protein
MSTTFKRGPARPISVWIALALAGIAAAGSAGQLTHEEPAAAMLQSRDPAQHPATLVVSSDEDTAALRKALRDLGESPLAAIYAAAGEDLRSFAQHNMVLADPFFEGRVPGSRGNRMAADYVEFYFQKAHLKPAFAAETKAADGTEVLTPNSSFRQTFARGNEIRVVEAEAEFDLGPGGTITLKPEQFSVLGSSGSGTLTAPIVLVGYGIEQGEDGYTNYPEDTDLSGKIAVIFRFEPMDEHGKSRWGEGWSPASSLDTKVKAAAERHAAGIILVNPPGADDPRARTLVTTQESRSFGRAPTIPVIMAAPEAVERLVRAGDPTDGPARKLIDFRKHFDEHSGAPIDLPGAKATLTTRMAHEPVMTDNVGAVLPGKGKLADQYVVIGAHYDHVGYGPIGIDAKNMGKLHPGADDNGSGTSGVLVLADKLSRAYADLPSDSDARSILFLAFSAEESGLVGSHYFVAHPSIDLSKIYLMLNMDMIGRLRERAEEAHDGGPMVSGLEVQGTESAEGFYEWLTPFFEASHLEIKHGSEVATNSDHASFYTKKIPVLFFFTGYHRQYHKPEDTAFLINQIGAVKVINLVHDIALAAVQRPDPLTFRGKREKEQDPHAAAAADPNLSKGVGGARLGIAPASYSDDKPGVEVGDVFDGTAAAEAGIKVGDRLMKWNGKDLPDVQAFTDLLRAGKPGDRVELVLTRGGKEMTVTVKLKARDSGGK